MEGDTIAGRDRLAHIVRRQTICKIELMVEPGLRGAVERLGCQTKAGEGSEIIGFDPIYDPGAHFLWYGRRSTVHFPLENRRSAG